MRAIKPRLIIEVVSIFIFWLSACGVIGVMLDILPPYLFGILAPASLLSLAVLFIIEWLKRRQERRERDHAYRQNIHHNIYINRTTPEEKALDRKMERHLNQMKANTEAALGRRINWDE